jgi:peptidyl-prolyl cis-trans isomerase D
VQPFATYCADKPIGEIGKVRSQFGIHIIEVLDRKGPNHPRLALIQKKLEPSSMTKENIEKEVYDLLYKMDEKLSAQEDGYKRVELFDTLASKEGYFARPVTVQETSPRLFGFSSKFAEDKILELMFKDEAKVGDLVNSPIKDGERYVLAILSSIKVKGETNFEDVKLAVKNDYIQEQKLKRLTAQMMKAKKLEDLQKGNATIMKAEVTFANPQITGAGFEPEVVGALFSGLKDGQMTKPVEGKQGVYVIRIDKTMKPPAASNYTEEQQQVLTTAKARVKGDATKALVEQADVIDNRRFYNIGIRR